MREPVSPHNAPLRDAYRAAISPLLAGMTDYALVDFPHHNNIGDSAIYLGQLDFLDATIGKGAAYVASLKDYRGDLATHCRHGPVLIHGGGNFGDLYPHHQEFRLRILADLPDRKVVQLPQSLHFEDGGALETTKRAIGKHRDFTLCVRDLPSEHFARREFDCPVVLSPDGAHCMKEVATAEPSERFVSLVRTDEEAIFPELARILPEFGPVVDWPLADAAVFHESETFLDRLYRNRFQWKFPKASLGMKYRGAMYRRRAQGLVDRGTRLLSTGRYVVSDRLHGHILCVLLGREHISLDNVTGKVGAYIEKWGTCGVTHWADSIDDLRRHAAALP